VPLTDRDLGSDAGVNHWARAGARLSDRGGGLAARWATPLVSGVGGRGAARFPAAARVRSRILDLGLGVLRSGVIDIGRGMWSCGQWRLVGWLLGRVVGLTS